MTFKPDIYNGMKGMKEYFDTSAGYPRDHDLYSIENKVIGKFKDELNKNILVESIALRPKCYADKVYIDGEVKILKKGKLKICKKNIHFDDYKKILDDKGLIRNQSTR